MLTVISYAGALRRGGRANGHAVATRMLMVRPLARLLYGLMYQKHVLSLHAFVPMAAQMGSHWVRTKVTPSVKLHESSAFLLAI